MLMLVFHNQGDYYNSLILQALVLLPEQACSVLTLAFLWVQLEQ